MKLTLEKTPFLNALSHVNGIVERKNTAPILANVLLETSQNTLHLKGTDMDIAITDKCFAQVQEDGATTTPVALLTDLVKKLPDGAEISLRMDGEHLMVSAGRSKFTLPTLPTDNFPIMTGTDMPHQFSIGATELADLIHNTKFAISTEETRYYLNGIYLHYKDESLCAVATDGHRLAKMTTPISADASSMPGVIIPRKTVLELHKLLEQTNGDVTVTLSESKIKFSLNEAVITSKLIDGNFPDYERVIPQDNTEIFHVPCSAFSHAVDRVATLSDGKMRPIKMHLDNNILKLSASHVDFGHAEDEIEIEYTSSAIETGFNASYLLDITNQFKDTSIIFELKDGASPSIIKCDDKPHVLYVLMPMRV